MALLNYSAFASLDGYIADEQGDFSWAMPSPEAHTLANELMEPIGTCIYGRRMYEMMTYWDTPEAIDEGSGIEYDFASPPATSRSADPRLRPPLCMRASLINSHCSPCPWLSVAGIRYSRPG